MKRASKLIIGAGERQEAGYLHHDIQDLPGIDLVCDFWDIPHHVKYMKLEEIKMTHVLEHFPRAKAPEVLKILYDLLIPGGRLYLEVPNFQWQGEQIALMPGDRQMVEYAYGGQSNKWDFHYNGFTPQILQEDLENAGFRITELKPNSSIECWSYSAK